MSQLFSLHWIIYIFSNTYVPLNKLIGTLQYADDVLDNNEKYSEGRQSEVHGK